MATAWVESGMNERKHRRRAKQRIGETIHGSRTLSGEDATALRIEVSRSIRQRAEQRFDRAERRLADAPERLSVRRAMLSIEQRLVEALWTLARLPGDRGIGYAKRNGLGYFHEYADKVEQAKAAGWLTTAPMAAPPDAKAIDAMHEPLDWLRYLDRERARILTLGAQYKRGDMARNIGWARIRERNPELKDYSARYLARRYHEALRTLVAELTIARMGQKR